MKILKLCLFTVLTSFSLNGSAQNYSADNLKSSIKWTGYAQAGTYAPSGTVNVKSGKLMIKNNRLSSTNLIVDMSSITQENKELEEHLKNQDFFDVKQFPFAFFNLTSIKNNNATGTITIKGVTRKISIPIMIKKSGTGLVASSKVKIDRTLFGIKYNSQSYFQDLGNYAIKNEIDLVLEIKFDQNF